MNIWLIGYLIFCITAECDVKNKPDEDISFNAKGNMNQAAPDLMKLACAQTYGGEMRGPTNNLIGDNAVHGKETYQNNHLR